MGCKKVQYDTDTEALDTIPAILEEYDDPSLKLRVYYCKMCFKYHITSKTVNAYKTKRKLINSFVQNKKYKIRSFLRKYD